MKEIETHPYVDLIGLKQQLELSDAEIALNQFQPGGIWFPDTRIIMCGTFPPKREYFERTGYAHYSSPHNQFWKHSEAVFNGDFYINSRVAANTEARIANAHKKVAFAREMQIGFVDLYTKISRRIPNSSADKDLEPQETIFRNGTIKRLLESGIQRFVFVYSLCRDRFFEELMELGIVPQQRIAYRTERGLLALWTASVMGREIQLVYSPIHGKNPWIEKQAALKLATDITMLG